MGTYFRLVDYACEEKEKVFLNANKNNNKQVKYIRNSSDFKKIPGNNFDYWISEQMLSNFDSLLGSRLLCKTGLICGNNEKYIRYWFEVNYPSINFSLNDFNDLCYSTETWYPYNHGGEKRRWYGSHYEVVNLLNNAKDMKSEKNSMFRNSAYYFQQGITWNRVGSGVKFAARLAKAGFAFDDVSPSGFTEKNADLIEILAYMNSKVFNEYLRLFSNGLKVEVGHIGSIPYIDVANPDINKLANECINIEKEDWNSFEISSDFEKHPLV